ncbi:MAG: FtsX-like permease family protein [Candidatus Bathyarchaeia archaeon]
MSDSEKWDFPVWDLSRRKFQTWLTIIGLVICVSVTVFLVLFGENLGVEITSIANGGLTAGFSSVTSRFIFIVVIFNSATGVLIDYSLIKTAILERVRDIGVMKAIGCLTEVVYSYFATELIIIVFTGCMFGIISGIAMNFAAIGLMNLLGFNISAKPPNLLLLMLIFSLSPFSLIF